MRPVLLRDRRDNPIALVGGGSGPSVRMNEGIDEGRRMRAKTVEESLADVAVESENLVLCLGRQRQSKPRWIVMRFRQEVDDSPQKNAVDKAFGGLTALIEIIVFLWHVNIALCRALAAERFGSKEAA